MTSEVTGTEFVEYRLDGRLAQIRLNRPEVRNALLPEMLTGLRAAFEQAVTDRAYVITLTGAGTVFCAGADLTGPALNTDFLTELLRTLEFIESVPATVVALLNGAAIGAGLQLAMASDLRVMAAGATIGLPAARIGITVDRWTVGRLATLLGNGHARSIVMANQRYDAARCYELGFANAIAEADEAVGFARGLLPQAPLSMINYKKILNQDWWATERSEEEIERLREVFASADLKEALAAKFEKREPDFQLR